MYKGRSPLQDRKQIKTSRGKEILTDFDNFLRHASLFQTNNYTTNYSNSGSSSFGQDKHEEMSNMKPTKRFPLSIRALFNC